MNILPTFNTALTSPVILQEMSYSLLSRRSHGETVDTLILLRRGLVVRFILGEEVMWRKMNFF
jgi:hypothetical protein